MKVSIIIPTFNNLNYLSLLINSILKNSNFKHEIILHINDGSDGTLNFARQNDIKHTHSFDNIGLCKSVNEASKLASTELLLYTHDDMFFCKDWDIYIKNELDKFSDNLYYITGTNVSRNTG